MAATIAILNGPNLGLLGLRQPEIYGRETLADLEARCRALAGELGLDVRFMQSDAEHEIIHAIHAARQDAFGIVINPAAYTHTSIAIMDALKTFEGPVVEVHISNVHGRESFRHRSYVSLVATAVMAGFGTHGYLLALRHMAQLVAGQAATR